MDYQTFCRSKHVRPSYSGFDIGLDDLGSKAWHWQKRCIQWAVKRGRAALFADTGLGKSLQQLLWADAVVKHTGGHIMGHCPVGVRWQTAREAEKFAIDTPVVVVNSESEIPSTPSICLVNYEKMHLFNTADFAGVFLDESSVLKGLTSKTREQLTEGWKHSRFRLACTATPAPNDTQELGNHAEFLGICTREEMLSKYFTHDSGDTSKWRLKGHAEADFWDWVCSWAVCLTRPSDIGGDDTGYILPELHEITHNVHVPGRVMPGHLFDVSGISATNIHDEKRHTSPFRAEKTAELIRSNNRPWLIWCDTNYEADDLTARIPEAVEIRGSDSEEYKEAVSEWFVGTRCICDLINKRRRIELCGSQNTQQTGEESTPNQKKKENAESRKEGQATKTLSTCETTTKKTQKGSKETKSSKRKSTPENESDTLAIQISESDAASLQRSDARQQNETEHSRQHLGSQLSNTTPCLKNKAGCVQSADQIKATTLEGGSLLITATPQERSGACSAQTATWESENSKTAKTSCSGHNCTCGHKTGRRILISKASIFGVGMNWQHCDQMIFHSINYSFESRYQAIRRCWRFGQTRPVWVHSVTTDTEHAIANTLSVKDARHDNLQAAMSAAMQRSELLASSDAGMTRYTPKRKAQVPQWLMS